MEIDKDLGNKDYIKEADIEIRVAEKLVEKNFTIATAESCTGGLVAARLINYPGISEVFKEGVVTYSNEAKINRLGVKKETLDKYGAVSSFVAEEMASGVAATSNTNVGISTTGIAGPGGGSAEKPVGLVYVGISINGEVESYKLNLMGDRAEVRSSATMELLNLLIKRL